MRLAGLEFFVQPHLNSRLGSNGRSEPGLQKRNDRAEQEQQHVITEKTPFHFSSLLHSLGRIKG
ncbi:MAG: hypothetical protein DMG23_11720 [Acidobacteria bacterium]|nr:MAG: hypothetical protein DMG23_11720 [Acidobacteriota bacterium]